MNNPHQNARLTVYSREQIVARIVAGQTAAEVAAAFAVSVRTVRKWLAGSARAGARRFQTTQAPPPASRDAWTPRRSRSSCIFAAACG